MFITSASEYGGRVDRSSPGITGRSLVVKMSSSRYVVAGRCSYATSYSSWVVVKNCKSEEYLDISQQLDGLDLIVHLS